VIDFARTDHFLLFDFAAGFEDFLVVGLLFEAGLAADFLAAGFAADFLAGAGLVFETLADLAEAEADLDACRFFECAEGADTAFAGRTEAASTTMGFSARAASASRVRNPSCQPGVKISSLWMETGFERRQRGQKAS
jgi:hypothetical protein